MSSGGSSQSDDGPPPLVLNLKGLERAVLRIYGWVRGGDGDGSVLFEKVAIGRYHEVFLAQCFPKSPCFEAIDSPENAANSSPMNGDSAQWECIIRFSREPESVAKLQSEVAAMSVALRHGGLPVPSIYAINFGADSANEVGAQYIIMEKLPGRHLYKLWDHLDLQDKKRAIEQIASVLVALSNTSYDKIGSLCSEFEETAPEKDIVGPLLFADSKDGASIFASSAGPFSTTQDYLEYFLVRRCGEEASFEDALDIVEDFFKSNTDRSCLQPPFRLIHGDFDAQNLLFVGGRSVGELEDLKLTGVIDWEYVYIGPVYYLYEYPIFIQDTWEQDPDYDWKAILRKHFILSLIRSFPKGSHGRKEVRECMQKEFVLEFCQRTVVHQGVSLKGHLGELLEAFVTDAQNGTGRVYDGRDNFENVRDIESEDETC